MKIGFFDSGIGGLTVLSEALKQLPDHEYLYYADTLHAPYGPKPKDEVRQYTLDAVDFLIERGADVIVIACNTATSIAATELRKNFNVPIIGMEPAVKPALEAVYGTKKRVLVTATPLTLKEEKLKRLVQQYDLNHVTDLCPLPDLVRFAEAFDFSDATVLPYLEREVTKYKKQEYGSVVLGCTHFPLFISQFEKLFPEALIINGSTGTVKRLEQVLGNGKVSSHPKLTIYRSGSEMVTDMELRPFLQTLQTLGASVNSVE